jgi:prolipoprotein diacylglyceryltransferase
MMPLVSLGPLRLGSFGLLLMAALVVWWSWSERRLKRDGILLHDWHFVAIIGAAWLAGRLGAVLVQSPTWSGFVSQMMQLRTIEFHGWAAVAGGLIASIAVARRTQIAWRQLWVVFALPTLAAHALVSVGAFLAGNGAGVLWAGPWAVGMLGALRHPVQLYEVLILGVGVAWLWAWEREHSQFTAWGAVLLWSAMVLLTAGFRADAWLLPGGIVATQLVALVVVSIAVERVMIHGRANRDEAKA